jgi:hypothetical protein
MTVLYLWPASMRRSWRQAVVLAVLVGLLGAVALGALAGARRTATAYGRYLSASNVSDVFVNVSGLLPGRSATQSMSLISSLRGAVSHAAYLGLNGAPVVRGQVVHSFLTGSVNGSLDGEFFRQDRLTVLAGRLPEPASTSEAVVTPLAARTFGTGVGQVMTYAFQPVDASGRPEGRAFTRSYTVTAIAEVPPALVDQTDEAEGTILPPGATRELLAEYMYGTVGLRLARGTAGIPALEGRLAALARRVQRQEEARTHQPAIRPSLALDRTDIVHGEVQEAIRPESAALIIFAVIAAAALIVLAGQGLGQMISRSRADLAVIRALGATRAEAALAASLPGLAAVVGGMVLAVAGAVALSPLAPVGPVRRYDPDRGIQADWLVLGAGTVLLAAALLGVLGVLAARSARLRPRPASRSPGIARAAARAGLPVFAVVGSHNALEPGSGARSVPVRSALLGSIAAVTAVVAAVTFDASLSGLASHPARYGWNSDIIIQAQGGYAPFNTPKLSALISGQPAVAGWSELGFTQLPVGGRTVPVVGIRRRLGSVQPPTTSGRPLSGPDQIELGQVTLNQLGKKIGDTVRIGLHGAERTVTITGTVTLPSFGQSTADHVSLGRGVMLAESTLLAAEGITSHSPQGGIPTGLVFPSAVAIDVKAGTTRAQRARLVHQIVSANPTGFPGGTYQLPSAQASAVTNAEHLGGQPLALALGLAAAAVLSLALTLLSLVRRRRQELALLKTLGMTRRQIRAIIAWQTTLTLAISVIAGGTLGAAAGRWAWRAFANSLGVAPVTEIPALALALGLLALVAAGNLAAAVPAAIAARTQPAAALRAE